MFGLSLLFKTYAASLAFLVFVLVLSPAEVVTSTNCGNSSSSSMVRKCESVGATQYFCTQEFSELILAMCHDAKIALLPCLLGLLSTFAFAGHLAYMLKTGKASTCDWIISTVFAIIWLIATIIMIYVSFSAHAKDHSVPNVFPAAAGVSFLLMILLIGEVVTIMRKPDYYYGLVTMIKSGPTSVTDPALAIPPPVSPISSIQI